MKISLKCSCGAEAVFDDPRGCDGGRVVKDEKGRIYQVELRADEWLDRHTVCVARGGADPAGGKAL